MRAYVAVALLAQQTHAWVSKPLQRSREMELAAESTKVTVLGGTGFVGSRVCKELVAAGADVVSVSKSGNVPAWCKEEDWTNSVSFQ
jgi:glutamate dehydrogenase/leucine dehydrogenase